MFWRDADNQKLLATGPMDARNRSLAIVWAGMSSLNMQQRLSVLLSPVGSPRYVIKGYCFVFQVLYIIGITHGVKS